MESHTVRVNKEEMQRASALLGVRYCRDQSCCRCSLCGRSLTTASLEQPPLSALPLVPDWDRAVPVSDSCRKHLAEEA